MPTLTENVARLRAELNSSTATPKHDDWQPREYRLTLSRYFTKPGTSQ